MGSLGMLLRMIEQESLIIARGALDALSSSLGLTHFDLFAQATLSSMEIKYGFRAEVPSAISANTPPLPPYSSQVPHSHLSSAPKHPPRPPPKKLPTSAPPHLPTQEVLADLKSEKHSAGSATYWLLRLRALREGRRGSTPQHHCDTGVSSPHIPSKMGGAEGGSLWVSLRGGGRHVNHLASCMPQALTERYSRNVAEEKSFTLISARENKVRSPPQPLPTRNHNQPYR